jgi:hypothetical protein
VVYAGDLDVRVGAETRTVEGQLELRFAGVSRGDGLADGRLVRHDGRARMVAWIDRLEREISNISRCLSRAAWVWRRL